VDAGGVRKVPVICWDVRRSWLVRRQPMSLEILGAAARGSMFTLRRDSGSDEVQGGHWARRSASVLQRERQSHEVETQEKLPRSRRRRHSNPPLRAGVAAECRCILKPSMEPALVGVSEHSGGAAYRGSPRAHGAERQSVSDPFSPLHAASIAEVGVEPTPSDGTFLRNSCGCTGTHGLLRSLRLIYPGLGARIGRIGRDKPGSRRGCMS
jgi:hypothetical protein